MVESVLTVAIVLAAAGGVAYGVYRRLSRPGECSGCGGKSQERPNACCGGGEGHCGGCRGHAHS